MGFLLGGLLSAVLPAARGIAGRVVSGIGGRLLGSGARMAVKTAVVTGGAKAAGMTVRKAATAAAGIGAGLAVEKMIGSGASSPVMVGNLNVNPFADTRRRKYRRINPTNPKALKRAMRRLEGFGEFAKAMGYSRPPKCIGGFKGLPKRKRASKCR